MDFQICEMTTAYAIEISTWTYQEQYQIYSMDNTDECRSELLGGEYYAVIDSIGELVGYFCFGEAAQVPIGRTFGVYSTIKYKDIGLGMKPQFCGQGKGYDFISAGICFAKCELSASELRLTVARFNQRAIKVYDKIGFREKYSFVREANNEKTEFLVMYLEG